MSRVTATTAAPVWARSSASRDSARTARSTPAPTSAFTVTPVPVTLSPSRVIATRLSPGVGSPVGPSVRRIPAAPGAVPTVSSDGPSAGSTSGCSRCSSRPPAAGEAPGTAPGQRPSPGSWSAGPCRPGEQAGGLGEARGHHGRGELPPVGEVVGVERDRGVPVPVLDQPGAYRRGQRAQTVVADHQGRFLASAGGPQFRTRTVQGGEQAVHSQVAERVVRVAGVLPQQDLVAGQHPTLDRGVAARLADRAVPDTGPVEAVVQLVAGGVGPHGSHQHRAPAQRGDVDGGVGGTTRRRDAARRVRTGAGASRHNRSESANRHSSSMASPITRTGRPSQLCTTSANRSCSAAARAMPAVPLRSAGSNLPAGHPLAATCGGPPSSRVS